MRKSLRSAVVVLMASTYACTAQKDPPSRPSPDLSPGEVVKIEIAALQHSNQPVPNAGIWTAFQFGSPANHRVTGPYGHFLQILKSAVNQPLLHARSARFYPVRQTETQAEEVVELTDEAGQTTRWVFSLSKQQEGRWRGCWMTDGVWRDPAST